MRFVVEWVEINLQNHQTLLKVSITPTKPVYIHVNEDVQNEKSDSPERHFKPSRKLSIYLCVKSECYLTKFPDCKEEPKVTSLIQLMKEDQKSLRVSWFMWKLIESKGWTQVRKVKWMEDGMVGDLLSLIKVSSSVSSKAYLNHIYIQQTHAKKSRDDKEAALKGNSDVGYTGWKFPMLRSECHSGWSLWIWFSEFFLISYCHYENLTKNIFLGINFHRSNLASLLQK